MSDDWPQDNSLDTELRGVPIPPGFMARLERLARYSDEQLDAAVCEVPLPAGLLERLERIDTRRRLLAPLGDVRRWAVAAAVFLAVGASLWGSLFLFIGSSYSDSFVHAQTAAPLDVWTIQVDLLTENSAVDLAIQLDAGSARGV